MTKHLLLLIVIEFFLFFLHQRPGKPLADKSIRRHFLAG